MIRHSDLASAYQSLMANRKEANLFDFLTSYLLFTKLAEVPMPRVESHYSVCLCVCTHISRDGKV